MSEPEPPTLNYEKPTNREPGIGVTPFIVGPVAGALIYFSAQGMNDNTLFMVTPACGFAIGLLCARAAVSREFRASFMGTALAVSSWFGLCILLLAVEIGSLGGVLNVIDLNSWELAFLKFACLFILPGWIASAVVWQYRHVREIRRLMRANHEQRNQR
jgi:hypothetical protein